MIRSVDEPFWLACPSVPGFSETGGVAASVDVRADLPDEDDPTDLSEVLLWEEFPCIASLNFSMSEALCINTENPCFCSKNVIPGISALNRTVLSHWPLFSINSRFPNSVCA